MPELLPQWEQFSHTVHTCTHKSNPPPRLWLSITPVAMYSAEQRSCLTTHSCEMMKGNLQVSFMTYRRESYRVSFMNEPSQHKTSGTMVTARSLLHRLLMKLFHDYNNKLQKAIVAWCYNRNTLNEKGRVKVGANVGASGHATMFCNKSIWWLCHEVKESSKTSRLPMWNTNK